MTAYCSAADVKLIINTTMGDTDIGTLIGLADAEIDARGLDFATDVKKQISMLITASLIALRDPNQKAIGEYREQFITASEWRTRVEDLITKLTVDAGAAALTGIPIRTVNEPEDDE